MPSNPLKVFRVSSQREDKHMRVVEHVGTGKELEPDISSAQRLRVFPALDELIGL